MLRQRSSTIAVPSLVNSLFGSNNNDSDKNDNHNRHNDDEGCDGDVDGGCDIEKHDDGNNKKGNKGGFISNISGSTINSFGNFLLLSQQQSSSSSSSLSTKLLRSKHRHCTRIKYYFVIYLLWSFARFYFMLSRNMKVPTRRRTKTMQNMNRRQQLIQTRQSLTTPFRSSSQQKFQHTFQSSKGIFPPQQQFHRSGSDGISIDMEKYVDNQEEEEEVCTPLPKRLQYIEKGDDKKKSSSNRGQEQQKQQSLRTLTKEQVEKQLPYMEKVKRGTTGNQIWICPRPTPRGVRCYGVVKKFRSKAVYRHVKRCLTILHHTGFTPRIMYADDETSTLVEEDLGFVTMLNAPIPIDFDKQIRHIHCVLREHSIIHRDLTYPNFIIEPNTGKMKLIDFGDAFIWDGGWTENQNYYQRNIENLFNLWWKYQDEQAHVEWLIKITKPEVKGDRQWRPPELKHQFHTGTQQRAGVLLLQMQAQASAEAIAAVDNDDEEYDKPEEVQRQ